MATTNGFDAGAVAAAALYREARLLDRGEWSDWVAMYREDAVYWVPAWLDEYETTNDPNTQCSLLYHDARRGLEERNNKGRSAGICGSCQRTLSLNV